MRKYYWYATTFIRKHGWIIFGSILGAVVIFAVIIPFIFQRISFKKKSFIGIVGFATLDTLPKEIQEKVGTGLTKITEDGSATGSLAERWSIEDEGKTYRFLLRKNILWQDETSVTPSDLNYSFNGVQVITNQNEIIFKLQNAYSPFPQVVSLPVFKRTVVRKNFWQKFDTLIGTGQYRISHYKQREGSQQLSEIELTSSRDHFIYRFYPTETEALSGFVRGEVDRIDNLTTVGELENWSNVVVEQKLDKQSFLAAFFNLSDPVFNSKELRLALNYATEKPSDESQVSGTISPNSWAFADVSKLYDYDLDRAVDRLLAMTQLPEKPIAFVLTTTSNFAQDAEFLKQSWEELGVEATSKCKTKKEISDKTRCDNLQMNIEIKILPYPELQNFQVLLVAQSVPADPDQYNLWHSNQPNNFTRYNNIRIDSLLEKGRQETDQRKRAEIYSEFQQFFSDDPPLILLRYITRFNLVKKICSKVNVVLV